MTTGRKRKERRRARQAREAARASAPAAKSPGPHPHVGQELFADHAHIRADTRMVNRAIREDWPIAPGVRSMAMTQMALVVGDKVTGADGKPVEVPVNAKIAAARVLVAADSVNARREALDLAAQNASKDDEQKLAAARAAGRAEAMAELGTQINISVQQNMQVIDPKLQEKAERYGINTSRLDGMLALAAARNGHDTNGHTSSDHNGNGSNGANPPDA